MRILRAENFRRMPWRNGGGVTVEIAASPEGAALDAFDWRISMAHVASDGPFSLFPGVDRTLALLSGAGMILDVAGRGEIRLDRDAPPCSFPGDAATSARLIAGPIDDLNVMTRRGRFRHRLTRRMAEGAVALSREGDVVAALLLGSDATTGSGDVCRDGDVLLIEKDGGSEMEIRPRGRCLLYVAELQRQ